MTNTRTFKPYHVRLREYQQRRAEIFNADCVLATKSRSSRRMHDFWQRQRSLRHFTVSSIVQRSGDIRPFTQVEILGKEYLALLDSGANKSVIGGNLAQHLVSNNLVLDKRKGIVRTAEGQSQCVEGLITVPLSYNSLTFNFEFLVVSAIKQDVICGMDFWEKFGISISPFYSVSEIQSDSSNDSLKIQLSGLQQSQLDAVISLFPSFEKSGLGVTTLIQHNIDTASAKPIKQRFYPLSPAK